MSIQRAIGECGRLLRVGTSIFGSAKFGTITEEVPTNGEGLIEVDGEEFRCLPNELSVEDYPVDTIVTVTRTQDMKKNEYMIVAHDQDTIWGTVSSITAPANIDNPTTFQIDGKDVYNHDPQLSETTEVFVIAIYCYFTERYYPLWIGCPE